MVFFTDIKNSKNLKNQYKNFHNEIDFFFRRNIRLSRKIKGNIHDSETSHVSEWLNNNINIDKDNIKILDIGAKTGFTLKTSIIFLSTTTLKKKYTLMVLKSMLIVFTAIFTPDMIMPSITPKG